MPNFVKKRLHKNSLPTISQVVVVEGKTDTNHLKRLFNVDTIETNGSALNSKTINLINKAAQSRGIILFLDPDYAGELIRRKILHKLSTNNYKEAFINQKIWKTFKKGVSEADDEQVIKAIKAAVELSNQPSINYIEWDQYNALALHTKNDRIDLCNKLNISYCNHKQLFKRLNMLNLKIEDLKKIINKYE